MFSNAKFFSSWCFWCDWSNGPQVNFHDSGRICYSSTQFSEHSWAIQKLWLLYIDNGFYRSQRTTKWSCCGNFLFLLVLIDFLLTKLQFFSVSKSISSVTMAMKRFSSKKVKWAICQHARKTFCSNIFWSSSKANTHFPPNLKMWLKFVTVSSNYFHRSKSVIAWLEAL